MILLAFIAATIMPFMAPIAFQNVRTLGIYAIVTGAALSFSIFGMVDDSLLATKGVALTIQLLLVISATHLLGVFARFSVLMYKQKHNQPAIEWLITLAFAVISPLAAFAG